MHVQYQIQNGSYVVYVRTVCCRNLLRFARGAHPDTDGREERWLGDTQLLVWHRGGSFIRRQVVQRGSRVLSLCPERDPGRQDFPHRQPDGEGEHRVLSMHFLSHTRPRSLRAYAESGGSSMLDRERQVSQRRHIVIQGIPKMKTPRGFQSNDEYRISSITRLLFLVCSISWLASLRKVYTKSVDVEQRAREVSERNQIITRHVSEMKSRRSLLE